MQFLIGTSSYIIYKWAIFDSHIKLLQGMAGIYRVWVSMGHLFLEVHQRRIRVPSPTMATMARVAIASPPVCPLFRYAIMHTTSFRSSRLRSRNQTIRSFKPSMIDFSNFQISLQSITLDCRPTHQKPSLLGRHSLAGISQLAPCPQVELVLPRVAAAMCCHVAPLTCDCPEVDIHGQWNPP